MDIEEALFRVGKQVVNQYRDTLMLVEDRQPQLFEALLDSGEEKHSDIDCEIVSRYQPRTFNPQERLHETLFGDRQLQIVYRTALLNLSSLSRSSSSKSTPRSKPGSTKDKDIELHAPRFTPVHSPSKRRRARMLSESEGEGEGEGEGSQDQSVQFNLEPRKVIPKEVGCNCRRSKCLKLYCECFNRREYCTPSCNCSGCGNVEENVEEHRKAVLQAMLRSPKAFEEEEAGVEASEGRRGFELGLGRSEVRRGCRCRKSHCLKRYCECFVAGQRCHRFCCCHECENVE